jgi:hypothetical protein
MREDKQSNGSFNGCGAKFNGSARLTMALSEETVCYTTAILGQIRLPMVVLGQVSNIEIRGRCTYESLSIFQVTVRLDNTKSMNLCPTSPPVPRFHFRSTSRFFRKRLD